MSLYCPMGCGDTVHTDYDQDISCRAPNCPDPDAIEKLLSDPETEHTVHLTEDSFIVKHPLRERLAEDLFTCGLHAGVRADLDNGNAPTEPGTYRVIYVGHDLVSSSLHALMCAWEPLHPTGVHNSSQESSEPNRSRCDE
jgi:hypothetical protein